MTDPQRLTDGADARATTTGVPSSVDGATRWAVSLWLLFGDFPEDYRGEEAEDDPLSRGGWVAPEARPWRHPSELGRSPARRAPRRHLLAMVSAGTLVVLATFSFEPGDVIAATGGAQTGCLACLQARLYFSSPGTPMTVTMRRGSTVETTLVDEGSAPP